VVVGPITSAPKSTVAEKKMQVGIGPDRTDYTLHFRDAQLFGLHGQKAGWDDLTNGMWIRAEGRTRDDERRIDVTRLYVVAKDAAEHKRSAFYRTGLDHGYVSGVAGTRQVFPTAAPSLSSPFTLIGKVTSDTGPLESTRKLQLQSRNFEWTLHVPKDAAVLDLANKPISVHEIKKGQWVRAHGWRTDDLRMRVERLENIGADDAFRTSTFFRATDPLGYYEIVDSPDSFIASKIAGTVVSVDKTFGSVVIRDAEGKEHMVYTDNATLMGTGGRVYFDTVKVGDSLTVEGRTYRFVR
jgi:hypothetical protein